jgi:hypothetical protein
MRDDWEGTFFFLVAALAVYFMILAKLADRLQPEPVRPDPYNAARTRLLN